MLYAHRIVSSGNVDELSICLYLIYELRRQSSNLRAENFRIVEINDSSPHFINLKIDLIFSLYPGKFVKSNQSIREISLVEI